MEIHRHDLRESRTSKRKIEIEVQKLIDVRGNDQRKWARDPFVTIGDYHTAKERRERNTIGVEPAGE